MVKGPGRAAHVCGGRERGRERGKGRRVTTQKVGVGPQTTPNRPSHAARTHTRAGSLLQLHKRNHNHGTGRHRGCHTRAAGRRPASTPPHSTAPDDAPTARKQAVRHNPRYPNTGERNITASHCLYTAFTAVHVGARSARRAPPPPHTKQTHCDTKTTGVTRPRITAQHGRFRPRHFAPHVRLQSTRRYCCYAQGTLRCAWRAPLGRTGPGGPARRRTRHITRLACPHTAPPHMHHRLQYARPSHHGLAHGPPPHHAPILHH